MGRSKRELEYYAELDQRNVQAIMDRAIAALAQLQEFGSNTKNFGLIDLYSERIQKKSAEYIGEGDTEEEQNGLIDLYSERMKRRRQK